MKEYLDSIMNTICDAVHNLNYEKIDEIVVDMINGINNGNKIIFTGLGKNAPICKKIEGMMLSFGIDATFLETNSAMHGDLGSIHARDVVIILSKSGETIESLNLLNVLKTRDVCIWGITFEDDSTMAKMLEKVLVIHMKNEGDLWDIVPNNSTTLYLIVLQAIVIQVASKLGITKDTFRQNHPGGGIGVKLSGQ